MPRLSTRTHTYTQYVVLHIRARDTLNSYTHFHSPRNVKIFPKKKRQGIISQNTLYNTLECVIYSQMSHSICSYPADFRVERPTLTAFFFYYLSRGRIVSDALHARRKMYNCRRGVNKLSVCVSIGVICYSSSKLLLTPFFDISDSENIMYIYIRTSLFSSDDNIIFWLVRRA